MAFVKLVFGIDVTYGWGDRRDIDNRKAMLYLYSRAFISEAIAARAQSLSM